MFNDWLRGQACDDEIRGPNEMPAGKDLVGYHVFNLIVHLLVDAAMFGLLRRTFCELELYRQQATWLAFASTLLWILHPLQTCAVTYISQRAESIMGLFFFLTFYCVVRGGRAARPWSFWYPSAIVACVLCVSSKEVGAVVPPLMLLFDRMYLVGPSEQENHSQGRFHAGVAAWREVFRKRRALHVALFSAGESPLA